MDQTVHEADFATYAALPWARTVVAFDDSTVTIRRSRRMVPGRHPSVTLRFGEIEDVSATTTVVRTALAAAVVGVAVTIYCLGSVLGPGGFVRLLLAAVLTTIAAVLSIRTSLRVTTDIEEVYDLALGFGERDEVEDFVSLLNHALVLAEARAAYDA